MYGAKIKAIRKEQKITQAELAKKIGTTQTSIARVENENGSTTVRTLEKIAGALGVNIIDLFVD